METVRQKEVYISTALQMVKLFSTGVQANNSETITPVYWD